VDYTGHIVLLEVCNSGDYDGLDSD